jgi:hypothetical protein
MNLKDLQKFDVYRINLANGAVDLYAENPGNVVSWTVDAQFQVRAATAATPDGGSDLLFRETTQGDWETLRHWGPDDEGGAVSFSEDGKPFISVAVTMPTPVA